MLPTVSAAWAWHGSLVPPDVCPCAMALDPDGEAHDEPAAQIHARTHEGNRVVKAATDGQHLLDNFDAQHPRIRRPKVRAPHVRHVEKKSTWRTWGASTIYASYVKTSAEPIRRSYDPLVCRADFVNMPRSKLNPFDFGALDLAVGPYVEFCGACIGMPGERLGILQPAAGGLVQGDPRRSEGVAREVRRETRFGASTLDGFPDGGR